MSSQFRLLVGLGNPGKEYARTRHSLGFAALERFADKKGIPLKRSGHHSIYAVDQRSNLILAKPQTMMNRSGLAVAELLSYYKLESEQMVVMHDDLDLAPHTLRFKMGGGSGGHNGLASIVQQTGSSDFVRLRIGIGKEAGEDAADYVLRDIPKALFDELADAACQALEVLLARGLRNAMNQIHAPKDDGPDEAENGG